MMASGVDPRVAKGLLFGGCGIGFLIGLVTLMKSTDATKIWGLVIVIANAAVAVFGFMQQS